MSNKHNSHDRNVIRSNSRRKDCVTLKQTLSKKGNPSTCTSGSTSSCTSTSATPRCWRTRSSPWSRPSTTPTWWDWWSTTWTYTCSSWSTSSCTPTSAIPRRWCWSTTRTCPSCNPTRWTRNPTRRTWGHTKPKRWSCRTGIWTTSGTPATGHTRPQWQPTQEYIDT